MLRTNPDQKFFSLANFLVALSLLLLSSLGSAVSADWLVTQDGQQIETQGEWKVEGRRVLYKTETGVLSAIRLSEINVEASQAATDRAKRGPQPRPNAGKKTSGKNKAALVLNSDNTSEHQAAPAARNDTAPEEQKVGKVEVADWKESQALGGAIAISGTVVNGSPEFATDIEINVTIFDNDGGVAGTKPAKLAKTALAPGAKTTLKATFENVYVQHGIRFKITNRAFVTQDKKKDSESEESGRE